MKIAYEKKLPEAEMFYELCQGTTTGDDSGDMTDKYTQLMQRKDGVVAAYDGDKLVGVGELHAIGVHAEAGEDWSFTILPGYVARDIASNMKKLVC